MQKPGPPVNSLPLPRQQGQRAQGRRRRLQGRCGSSRPSGQARAAWRHGRLSSGVTVRRVLRQERRAARWARRSARQAPDGLQRAAGPRRPSSTPSPREARRPWSLPGQRTDGRTAPPSILSLAGGGRPPGESAKLDAACRGPASSSSSPAYRAPSSRRRRAHGHERIAPLRSLARRPS